MSEHDVLEAALRGDLSSFIQKAFQVVSPADTYKHNWHVDLIADHLERCYRGEIKRLIITVPPRSLKSICASVAFRPWVLGKDPSRKLICASYSSELASKLARDCRAVMETAWCRRVFPGTRLKRSAELDLETTRRGVRYATSVGGSFKFAAQYQQNPVPVGGNLIQFEWFPFYDAPPFRQPGDRVVQSWDTATKTGELNDYSVCVTVYIQGNEFYVLDVPRERLIYPDLKRKVIHHALAFNARTILVEDSASGTALIQDIRQMKIEGAPKPIAVRPEGEKAMRMNAQSSKIEAGQVFLPERASWIDEFRTELLAFPYGRYDDQVDALSQLLNWIDRSRRNRATCRSF